MATASAEEVAVRVRLSLSASLNTPARDADAAPLSWTSVTSVMARATVGARLVVCCCCCRAAVGVVCAPLVRTHWLECALPSEWLSPVKERTNTPVVTPLVSPVMT